MPDTPAGLAPVLANMARIAHIPATLIHGVYDAGHFGGTMGEQFTAAIDAMADHLHPA